MLFTHVVALGVVAVALAAAGCGKSSTTTSSATSAAATSASAGGETGARPTRAVFIAQADAICAGYNAKRPKVVILSLKDYATKLGPLAAYYKAEADRLSALKPPISMASDWHQIVSGSREAAADLATVARSGKVSQARSSAAMFATAGRAQTQVLAIAKRNGFKDCSRVN